MPWPVWSERFLFINAGGSWQGSTVPGGRRWVLRSISASPPASGGIDYIVSVTGGKLWEATIQAADASQLRDCRHVMYPGERVEGFMSVSGGALCISGFAFQTAAGLANEPPPQEDVPPPDWFLELGQQPATEPASRSSS